MGFFTRLGNKITGIAHRVGNKLNATRVRLGKKIAPVNDRIGQVAGVLSAGMGVAGVGLAATGVGLPLAAMLETGAGVAGGVSAGSRALSYATR